MWGPHAAPGGIPGGCPGRSCRPVCLAAVLTASPNMAMVVVKPGEMTFEPSEDALPSGTMTHRKPAATQEPASWASTLATACRLFG